MSQLKILIVEDEPVIAENISIYLNNNDFEVGAIAYDADEALEQLRYNTPDAVILDINLEGGQDGIDIARHINKQYHIPFLFLTSYSDKSTLERAKQVQPAGYIVKPFNERTLLASLEIAISNHAADMNNGLPELSLDKINKGLLSLISQREFDVLQLVYNGVTNNQIAAQLFISVNTIKTHLKNIYLKLDVNSRLELMNKLRKID